MNLLLIAYVSVALCAFTTNPRLPVAGSQLMHRASPPPDYSRIQASDRSFASWLRRLPLRAENAPVRLYNGKLKGNQDAHYAVIDMDIGSSDLQQCADAVIRLHAEYLFSLGCDDIHFNFTNGETAYWREWKKGMRPQVQGNRVSWHQTASPDTSYASFRKYLNVIFNYAGSYSLEKELTPVADPSSPRPGDVFIQGGFPGHAVIIIDVAENSRGERIFLLAQSYMPAQDIHILKSFENISPWYRARKKGALRTPEWKFKYGDLRRFPAAHCDGAER